MAGGRPTKYNDEILDKAVEYVTLFFDEETVPENEVMPSIEGLALYLEISRPTIYDWASQEDKKEFSYIVEKLLAKQGLILLTGTLTNKLNSSIGKAILSKHGYSEKTEVDTKIEHSGEIDVSDKKTKEIATKYEEELKETL